MRVLIQTKSNLVASFQIMDISVSFLKVWSDALVIYQNFIIETPGWNPDSQGAVGGNDLVADRKIIRISCLASDEILVIKLDIAISVKVTVIGCLVGRIRVFSNRSNRQCWAGSRHRRTRTVAVVCHAGELQRHRRSQEALPGDSRRKSVCRPTAYQPELYCRKPVPSHRHTVQFLEAISLV